jgi:release factor glutamine methyltransferase
MSFVTNVKQALSVWLIRKIQKYGPRSVHVLGNTYHISENVFNPKYYYTSRFMARHINVRPDDSVLDMGTGSGIQAITAARTAFRVVAIDINPEAVQYAAKNAGVNGLSGRIFVLEGDLFSPLGRDRKFSVILFTPPYLQGSPGCLFDHALFDRDNRLLKRFFKEAREFISPDGYVQMVYSSIADPGSALKISREFGWRHEIIAREKITMEEFFIYRFRLDTNPDYS